MARTLVVARSSALRERVIGVLRAAGSEVEVVEAAPRTIGPEVSLVVADDGDVPRALAPARTLALLGDHRGPAWAALGGDVVDAVHVEMSDEELEARVRGALGRRAAERLRTMNLVAHDLNNPLAAIRILSEMLEADATDPEFRRDMHDFLEAVDTANVITDAIGGVVRLERGHRELSFAPVDVGDLLVRAADRVCLRDHVEVMPSASILVIDGDADALAQALTEILFNARRLTSEGGLARAWLDGRVITVASKGIRVPPEIAARLILPWGAGEAREKRIPVAALGLAYAAWALAQHRATIDLEDAAAGLVVRIRF